jgi:hypothetical protein
MAATCGKESTANADVMTSPYPFIKISEIFLHL